MTNIAEIHLSENTTAKVSIVTLTSADKDDAPKQVKIEVSNDGNEWKNILEKNDLDFTFDKFILPVAIDEANQGNYKFYKLTLYGGTSLAEIELLGEKVSEDALDELFPNESETEAPSETCEPTETAPQTPQPKGNSSLIVFIVIGCVVAIGAIAAVVVIVLKKKSAK